MARDVIIRGGIEVRRDPLGNLTIITRGNGQCTVQAADIDDLSWCLVELDKDNPRKSKDGG